MNNFFVVELRNFLNTEMLYLVNAKNSEAAKNFVSSLEDVYVVDAVRKAENSDIEYFKNLNKDAITIH